MKRILSTLVFFSLMYTSAFSQQKKMSAWDGAYRGVLPCADCEGLQETIYLKKNMSYKMETRYLGKSDSLYTSTGKFSLNKEKNLITLTPANGQPEYFVLDGNSVLTQSDATGKKMDAGSAGQFILSKNQYAIVEKYWSLIELNGKSIKTDSNSKKESHISFATKGYRVSGNSGCNNFTGSFILTGANHITISKVASTRMACPGMDVEAEFLKVLGDTDSYDVKGGILSLKNAGAVLAKFTTIRKK
ncbi:MAG: META domain-containing protein [Bacteroidetes bacterium]|nr:META domain-containing protein [Bacteroidota bacterium]